MTCINLLPVGILVVRLLRQQILGDSYNKVQNQIREKHSEFHMKGALQDREPFHDQAQRGMFTIASPDKEIPPMLPIPQVPWFLVVHIRDVTTG